MSAATTKCPLGLKHKYEWVKDITLTTLGKRPGYIRLSRRGVYRCACGQERNGVARSGL